MSVLGRLKNYSICSIQQFVPTLFFIHRLPNSWVARRLKSTGCYSSARNVSLLRGQWSPKWRQPVGALHKNTPTQYIKKKILFLQVLKWAHKRSLKVRRVELITKMLSKSTNTAVGFVGARKEHSNRQSSSYPGTRSSGMFPWTWPDQWIALHYNKCSLFCQCYNYVQTEVTYLWFFFFNFIGVDDIELLLFNYLPMQPGRTVGMCTTRKLKLYQSVKLIC